jgi:hypothetical protein
VQLKYVDWSRVAQKRRAQTGSCEHNNLLHPWVLILPEKTTAAQLLTNFADIYEMWHDITVFQVPTLVPVKDAPYHAVRPRIASGRSDYQMLKVTANMLNTESRMADRRCSPAWLLSARLTSPHRKRNLITKPYTGPRTRYLSKSAVFWYLTPCSPLNVNAHTKSAYWGA